VVEIIPNSVVRKLCIHFNHIYDEFLDPTCIEHIDIDSIIKEALGYRDLSHFQEDTSQPLVLVFVFPNYFGNDMKKKLLVDGLESLVKVYASQNLFSKINIVGIKYSEDIHFPTLGEIVSFFLTTKISAIMHGNLIPISNPQENTNNSTILTKNSLHKPTFSLILDAFEGIGLAITLALAASTNYVNTPGNTSSTKSTHNISNLFGSPGKPSQSQKPPQTAPPLSSSLTTDSTSSSHSSSHRHQTTITTTTTTDHPPTIKMHLITTYRPGNYSFDHIYDELLTKYPQVSILCLPLDPFHSESYQQLATAIKDSNITLDNIIYSFAKDAYRKPIHPIHIHFYLKLFTAFQEMNIMNNWINHVFLTAENSVRPFPENPEVNMDFVSNHMELTFAKYLKTIYPSNLNKNQNNNINNAGISSRTTMGVVPNTLMIVTGCHEVDRQRKEFYQEAVAQKTDKAYLRGLPKSMLIDSKEIGNLVAFLLMYPKEFHENLFVADCGMHLHYHSLLSPTAEMSKKQFFSITNDVWSQIQRNNSGGDNSMGMKKNNEGKTSKSPNSGSSIKKKTTATIPPLHFAHNLLFLKTALKYLPEYLSVNDFSSSTTFGGNDNFKDYLLENASAGLSFGSGSPTAKRENIFVANSLQAAIFLLGCYYRKISFTFPPSSSSLAAEETIQEIRNILSFDPSIELVMDGVSKEENCSRCHIYYASTPQITAKELQKQISSLHIKPGIPLFIVVYKNSQFFSSLLSKDSTHPHNHTNQHHSQQSEGKSLKQMDISFLYEFTYLPDPSIKCGVIISHHEKELLRSLSTNHTGNNTRLSLFSSYFSVSCFVQSYILQKLNHPLVLETEHTLNNETVIPTMVGKTVGENGERKNQAIPNSSTSELPSVWPNTLQESLQQFFLQYEHVTSLPVENILLFSSLSMVLFLLGTTLFSRQSPDESTEERPVLMMDSPFDHSFKTVFETHCRITIETVPFRSFSITGDRKSGKQSRNSLLQRVKRAWEDGYQGYLIMNPHSPTGHIYSTKEIDELCQWHCQLMQQTATETKSTQTNRSFHLIFNESFAYSIHEDEDKSRFQSVLQSQSNPCLHVLRGFSKSSGFEENSNNSIDFLITTNPLVLSAYQKYRLLLAPIPFQLKMMNHFCYQSFYGQKIYHEHQWYLSSHAKKVCFLLEKENIVYIKPQSGFLFFISLHSVLINGCAYYYNEFHLWKKLNEQICVNLIPGKRENPSCLSPMYFFRLNF
jgi:hypothetical protein